MWCEAGAALIEELFNHLDTPGCRKDVVNVVNKAGFAGTGSPNRAHLPRSVFLP